MALIVIGCFVSIYTITRLELGSGMQMGPGMFPAALGMLLAALGLAILVPALRHDRGLPRVEWRPAMAVLSSILVFAVTIRPFGLLPAIVALTLIATRADSRLSILGTMILAAVLATIAFLIFHVGLGATLPILNWPF